MSRDRRGPGDRGESPRDDEAGGEAPGPWIEVIEPPEATGRLRRLYEQVATPEGHVDRILQVHSLRPRTLRAHLSLYRATLHARPTALSPRERELVGVVVSALNGCVYCVAHHRAGLARHVGDADLARRLVEAALERGGGRTNDRGTGDGGGPAAGTGPLTPREGALCDYARRLTRRPDDVGREDLEPLRRAGLDDAGILDLNQVVAYFAYANRTVQGLGVRPEGEPLGLHPDEDRDDLTHR